MIIVRIPFRLPIGGGGTDLPAYYQQHEGQLITASINKYMYVSINEPATGDKIKLYYRYAEIVDVNDIDSIKHDIIRECLKLHNVNRPIEIGSMADIDAQTGMGSSSVFTVGLIAGLYTIERQIIDPRVIAEEACRVEIDLVGKPIGKQDQYAAAFGGINELHIQKSGKVTASPLYLDNEVILELESRLLMFYTNITRDANQVLADQGNSITTKTSSLEAMHKIKDIGICIKQSLLEGDIDHFGRLLNTHWQIKKTASSLMTNSVIDNWYDLALKKGALGGKIMGAGGGGLFLFCAKRNRRKELKEAMEHAGLKHMDFRFEFEGVKLITNY